jgi:hypothetical protein
MTSYDISELAEMYRRGENVMAKLRDGGNANSTTALLYAYDLQSGSYTRHMADPAFQAQRAAIASRIAGVLRDISCAGLLEAGVGEATTLKPVLEALGRADLPVAAFDISLSRLLYARKVLGAHAPAARLFAGELSQVPLLDGAVDTVFTFHALEPNRGRETAILRELLRVARRALVMVEPGYETAGPDAQARMDRLGYVRGLASTLRDLGFVPARHEPFGLDVNPLNPAMLTVVVKEGVAPSAVLGDFVSSVSGKRIVRRPDCLFCPEDGHAFPVIAGIPCLAPANAVLVSHLESFAADAG